MIIIIVEAEAAALSPPQLSLSVGTISASALLHTSPFPSRGEAPMARSSARIARGGANRGVCQTR